jgi:hypothetical protein
MLELLDLKGEKCEFFFTIGNLTYFVLKYGWHNAYFLKIQIERKRILNCQSNVIYF